MAFALVPWCARCRTPRDGGSYMGVGQTPAGNCAEIHGSTTARTRHATDPQVLKDGERLIAAWNERQARRMPLLFAPTIGAAVKARC